MKHRLLAWLRRRWLLVLVTVAFFLLVIFRFADLQRLAETLVQGQWQWILSAILLQVIYYILLGLLYQAAFAVVGVMSRLRNLMPVLLASVFVTTLAPTGGVSGAALFVDDAARRRQSAARAAEGVLLVWVAQNLALLPPLAAGLAYLAATGSLVAYQLAGTVIFLLLVAALTGALLLGRWQAGLLQRVLAWIQVRVNSIGAWFRRPQVLAADWSETNACEFSEAASAIATHPSGVGYTLGIALAHTAANLATLYVLFLAYGLAVSPGLAAAGFSLSIVFAVLSILPFDVGLMQGVMAVVFTTQGVPLTTALAVVLVFGGLNAWLPVLVGFFFLREVKTFGG